MGILVRRRSALVALIAALSLVATLGVPAAAGAAPPALGALTQLSGTAGCLSIDGSSEAGLGSCAVAANGVNVADGAIVSPDGRSVYVTTYLGELGVFSRSLSTGALTQLPGAAGCFAATATPCTVARGISGSDFGDGRDMAITSDGLWLYAVSQGGTGGSVMIFQRNPSTSALTQLPGTAGCLSTDGSSQAGANTCQIDASLNSPSGISLSPDNHFLYVIDYGHPKRILTFSRSASGGALAEIQCLSEAPAATGCQLGRVLGNSKSLAISADGLHAYGGDYQHGISVFDRDRTTGLLTQKAGNAGCITDTGHDDTGTPTCALGRVMDGVYPVTLAPNGATLYAPAGSPGDGIAIFHVNSDGTLTQLAGTAGCITQDGKDELGNSTCAIGRDLNGGPYGGEISSDGRDFYAANDGTNPGGIDTFGVDPSTGALTQLPGTLGCTTSDGTSDGTPATAGQCAIGRALEDAYSLAISPDGASVYVAADRTGTGSGLAVFARQTVPICAGGAAPASRRAPAHLTLHCASPNGEPVMVAIAAQPAHGVLSALNATAGTVVYTPAAGYAGPDSFTFLASDGTNLSAAARESLTVSSTAPVFTGKVGESAKKFREGKSHSRATHKLPALIRFSFTLDQAAKVKFTFLAHLAGRRSNGRCVKPTKSNHHAKSCSRKRGAGTLTVTGKAGANKLTFSGRLSAHHRLAPGTYSAALTAKNAKGQTSKPHTLVFTIVKG